MSIDRDRSWTAALERAGELARESPVTADEGSWDYAATRGLIAVALHILADGNGTGVEDVSLAALAPPLMLDADQYVAWAQAGLETAGHNRDAMVGDPVAQQWRWLNLRWDPDAAPGRRWDGLTRGIARGLPDPATHVCLLWAASAVTRFLERERGALERRTQVLVTDGEFAGERGVIASVAWRCENLVVTPGPVSAYVVRWTAPPAGRTAVVLAGDMEPAQ